jgi:hypothetical protein
VIVTVIVTVAVTQADTGAGGWSDMDTSPGTEECSLLEDITKQNSEYRDGEN